jgi:hypothetical protein
MKTTKAVKAKLKKNVDSFLDEWYFVFPKCKILWSSPDRKSRVPTREEVKETLLRIIKDLDDECTEVCTGRLRVHIYYIDAEKMGGGIGISLEENYE